MPSSVVATLIANPSEYPLSEAGISRIVQGVGGFNSWRWLSESAAADLLFDAPAPAIKAALKEALADAPIDVIVQPAEHRVKRLLVADMDSTLIGQECVDELAAYAGVGDRVAEITERAMQGEIAFEPALRERVALLAGLPASAIADVLRDREAAGLGVAYYAKPKVAAGAHARIDHTDLTALLYAQGIARSDFVER